MRSDAGDAIRAFEEKHGAKVFEKLVEYPCEFTIKVIGMEDADFASDMVGYISKTVNARLPSVPRALGRRPRAWRRRGGGGGGGGGSVWRATRRPAQVAASEIKYSTNPSSKGTYTSVTIEAPVKSSDELYQCYAILRNDPRVKMAL